ncbi:MAG: hypothetical protein ACI9K1_000785, partial [Arcticibacterium sp.]
MKRQILLLLLMCAVYVLPAQDTTVSGIITDVVTGEPLVGATVIVKGTTNGVTTNLSGEFSVAVNAPIVLQISFIGYGDQEVVIDGPQTEKLSIQLDKDITKLNEVVVSGLASTVKRSNLAN